VAAVSLALHPMKVGWKSGAGLHTSNIPFEVPSCMILHMMTTSMLQIYTSLLIIMLHEVASVRALCWTSFEESCEFEEVYLFTNWPRESELTLPLESEI
jgi:hypothetical protein